MFFSGLRKDLRLSEAVKASALHMSISNDTCRFMGSYKQSYKSPNMGYNYSLKSRVISPLIWVINLVTLLITPLITTHGPPSTSRQYWGGIPSTEAYQEADLGLDIRI